MFEDLVGSNGTRFVIATAAVALGLLILVVVLRFLRNRPSSPFVRGGKNRQPRLAVLDAAAVDARRRLVLIRRDDVEHLVMIGGPSDIVIESRITGARPAVDQPVPAGPGAVHTAAPHPKALPPETAPARSSPERRPEPRPESRIAPVTPPVPVAPAASASAAMPSVPPVSGMGNVLYGEERSPAPARAPAPAPRVAAEIAPRAMPVASAQQAARQPPVPARPVTEPQRPANASGTPEDILDAARNRVLATQQSPETRTAPQPVSSPPAVPSPANAPGEFERLLDAEISGDLGRLGADPAQRPAPPQSRPVGAQRTEPSLEEEMNRMLSEMGETRRP